VKSVSKNYYSIGLAVVLSGAAISGAYFYKQAKEPEVFRNNGGAAAQVSSVQVLANRISSADTDSDGLKDWEEELWGSDSLVPDSDKDGTPDGDEVLAGRNPAIAGPTDSTDVAPIGTESSLNISTDLNLTDEFSKEIFARYAAYKKTDNSIDTIEQQNLIEQLLTSAEAAQKPAIVHKFNELIVVPDTQENYRRYRDIFVQTTSQYEENITNNELLILERALKNNDSAALRDIDPLLARYAVLIQEMLALPIPNGIAQAHLDLVNGYEKITVHINAFKDVFTDPLVAMTNMTNYYQTASDFSLALSQIKKKLTENGASI